MDTIKKPGVPKILPVLIVVILAAMYYVAAFHPDLGKASGPEKTVEDFYSAYLASDYPGMAQNLSVFWSMQYMPEYAGYKPSEMIAQRDTIETRTAEMLSSSPAAVQEGLTVSVLPEYTKEMSNSALVVYAGTLDDQELGREAALLVKENKDYYIYTMLPLPTEEALPALEEDFAKFDTWYSEALTNDQW